MTKEEAIKILQGEREGLLTILDNVHYERQHTLVALDMAIKALEQTPKTWGLDDAREDFMNDVYNTLDFLPTNNEANRIIDSFDRVTSGLEQQPCEDCISREAVDTLVDELARAISDERCCISRGRSTATIMQDILDLPPVTPKEKRGKWIYTGDYITDGMLKCSSCGYEHDVADRFLYCPNCGRKMIEPQESEVSE